MDYRAASSRFSPASLETSSYRISDLDGVVAVTAGSAKPFPFISFEGVETAAPHSLGVFSVVIES